MLRSIRRGLVVGILGCGSFELAVSQELEKAESKNSQDHLERLRAAIPSVDQLEYNASHQIPALIAVVENGKPDESGGALRALAAMKSNAAPAIAAIGEKLGDPDHAVRSAAVDAMVAIRDAAVIPLQRALGSPTARTRAAATGAWGRLKRLEFSDAARLSAASDPRVRAAADAVSTLGKATVPRLADMLVDPEFAVAVVAARALRSNPQDPPIAIPKLTRALSRMHLASPAADALAAYGALANRAIPALIEVRLEDALRHLGPPSDLDIPQLCEILLNADEEIRILAAERLATLGTNGKSASAALEAAADKSMNEYVRLKRSPKSQTDERFDNSGRVFLAGECCAAAVWDVTHELQRFLNLIQRLAIAAGAPLTSPRLARLQDPSANDCRQVEAMLRHSNLHVQQTALNVLTSAGPKPNR
jgi:HEAT repeat protein